MEYKKCFKSSFVMTYRDDMIAAVYGDEEYMPYDTCYKFEKDDPSNPDMKIYRINHARFRIYINDILIQSNILLEGDFQQFEISLKKGFNKIDIEAINQGTSGPNTAEFQVYDEKGGLISQNQWNLATGYKASIVVVRE